MLTKLQIYNLALSHLKEAGLTTVIDDRKARTDCDTHYDIARLTLLKKHDWSFARQVLTLEALTPDDDEKIEGYDYYFEIPDEVLAIRGLYLTGNYKNRLEITEFYLPVTKKKVIVSTYEELDMVATVNIEDTLLFDITFCDALSFELAGRMCATITGDDNLSNIFYQKSEIKVQEAKTANMSERYEFQNRTSDTLSARG